MPWLCVFMKDRPTNIALLGSTGSIGRSTIEVVLASPERFRITVLTANSSTDKLVEQSKVVHPDLVVATDLTAAGRTDWTQLPQGVELRIGAEEVARAVAAENVDIVVSAIVGSAGLMGTWAALQAGKTVALANKESLVVGGHLITRLAKEHNTKILPVDSEHCAVFQALQAGRPEEVRRVVLTASGGPFRNYSDEQLAGVTIADALAHPTWNMGPKITVDSATLMNKALEIIEARWLFDLEPDKIGVMIHPQSIVHSMVEYIDGSIIAQLSPPDMKLPIQCALSWPDRYEGVARRLDWSKAMQLDFEPPDYNRCGALKLGLEVARVGGTAGAVLSAANEAAVAAFLAGQLRFTDIVAVCRSILDNHQFDSNPSLERLFELDRWARNEVSHWICS